MRSSDHLSSRCYQAGILSVFLQQHRQNRFIHHRGWRGVWSFRGADAVISSSHRLVLTCACRSNHTHTHTQSWWAKNSHHYCESVLSVQQLQLRFEAEKAAKHAEVNVLLTPLRTQNQREPTKETFLQPSRSEGGGEGPGWRRCAGKQEETLRLGCFDLQN